MAEVLRLSIVYDTARAAAQIVALDRHIDSLNKKVTASTAIFAGANNRWATTDEIMAAMAKDTEKATKALNHMTPAMAPLASPAIPAGIKGIQRGLNALAGAALGIPGPVGNIATGLLMFGAGGTVALSAVAGIALIAGALKLLGKEAADAEVENKKLLDRLMQLGTHGAVVAAQIKISAKQIQLAQVEAQLLAFDNMPAAQRNFEASKRAGLVLKMRNLQKEIADITNTELLPASNKDAEAARKKTDALQDQLNILHLIAMEEQHLTKAAIVRFSTRGDTLNAFDRLRFGQDAPAGRDLGVGFGQRPDSPLRSLDTNFQGANLGLGVRPEELLTNEVTAQQQRIVDSWTEGMHTMQDAMEDFLVTGKLSIEALVDSLLRIAFRAATDDFVAQATKSVIRTFSGSGAARRAAGFEEV